MSERPCTTPRSRVVSAGDVFEAVARRDLSPEQAARLLVPVRSRLWFVVHNLLAHPLLAVAWWWRGAHRFHDWTAERI